MATDALLELDALVAGYGRLTVLDGASCRVRRRAVTTVIGPNGAGKSTLFKTVFGLLPARAGRVLFDGRDVTNLPPRRLLEQGIAYVPQGRNLFPELSVLHNLELGAVTLTPRSAARARVEAMLDRFPVLRQKARAQASTLSGGEQKLLEIARGLLLDPRLLLLDEPSVGLSPRLSREVLELVRALGDAGVTVLMVEQNARGALGVSDDGIVLELGRVRMQAPARAILEDPRIGRLFLGGTTREGETATREGDT